MLWKTLAFSLLYLTLACCGAEAASARRLSEIVPSLTRDLTPDQAWQELGEPDEVTGSGLLIYVYCLENDRSVWLFFPGYEPIQRAAIRNSAGKLKDLPIQSGKQPQS